MTHSDWNNEILLFHKVIDDPNSTDCQVDLVTRGLCHLASEFNEEHPESRKSTTSEFKLCLSKVHKRMGDQWFAQHAAVFACHCLA